VPEASLPLTWRLLIIVNLVFTVIVYSKMFFLKDKLELKFTKEAVSNYAYLFASIAAFYVYIFTLIDFVTKADPFSLLFKVVVSLYLVVGYLLFRKLSKDFSD
jgi:L-asparagine transporter-like permease